MKWQSTGVRTTGLMARDMVCTNGGPPAVGGGHQGPVQKSPVIYTTPLQPKQQQNPPVSFITLQQQQLPEQQEPGCQPQLTLSLASLTSLSSSAIGGVVQRVPRGGKGRTWMCVDVAAQKGPCAHSPHGRRWMSTRWQCAVARELGLCAPWGGGQHGGLDVLNPSVSV